MSTVQGLLSMDPVDVAKWVRRSNAAGSDKPLYHFEQFFDGEFLIRLFDGPTAKNRRDFHINTRAEFFYQLQGDMACTLIENDEFEVRVVLRDYALDRRLDQVHGIQHHGHHRDLRQRAGRRCEDAGRIHHDLHVSTIRSAASS